MTLMELRTKDIMEARAKGVTFKIIAEQLGISTSRVQEIVKREKRKARIAAAAKAEMDEAKAKNDVGSVKIDVLNLSCRYANVLYSEEIKTLGELTAKTEIQLLRIPNMGMGGVNAIKKALAQIGMNLAR